MNSIAKPVRKKATINMIAVPTIIRAGDSSTLSGQVRVKGRPAAGIVVIFSVDPSLGAVIPAITVTDAKGGFTATFRSFIQADQPAFTTASVTAALPSFPGVFTSSVVGIVRTSKQLNT